MSWAGRQLHLIGIGGAGMSGLALVAHERGARVSGSDRADSAVLARLRDAGLEPRLGHDPGAVPPDAEVVVSTAIAPDNPELSVAQERGQRILHRAELLAELCAERRLIAVAGAHGKTTTAAMLVHALRAAGHDPPFFLGGELPGAGPEGGSAGAGWGEGSWAVAEADESDGSFLRLSPEVAVITNIELDHHAHWGSLGELEEAFRRFLGPARGVVLGEGLGELEPEAEIRRLTTTGERTGIAADGEAVFPELRLAVPGEHNVRNALCALAAAELAGFDPAPLADALASFPGVARRLELKGERSGALVYDDYAHHPTEVRAALDAARTLGPRRLVAVFQPHLYSRTRALAAEFGAALAGADAVGVLEVYPAREEPVGALAGVSGLMVAEAAADRARGKPVWWLRDIGSAARALGPRIHPGDLVLTLGAGDVWRLAEMLVAEDGEGVGE